MGVLHKIKELHVHASLLMISVLFVLKLDEFLDLVYMDIWDPYKIATHKGMSHFLTLVDD